MKTRAKIMLAVLAIPAVPIMALVVWLFAGPVYYLGYDVVMRVIHVRDPADPAFSKADFNPAYYAYADDLESALRVMFPAGTLRQEVDRLLIQQVGVPATEIKQTNGDSVVNYEFPEKNSVPSPIMHHCGSLFKRWLFHFTFAPTGELRNIHRTDWSFCYGP